MIIERYTDLMNCNSVAAWRDMIFRFSSDLGYEKTLLAILPDPHAPVEAEFAVLHSNYSAEWRNKYDDQRLQHVDPTFQHCRNKSIPLIWSPEIFSDKPQKEMYEEASSHGLRSGVTLPIHGHNGELGTLCFVNDTAPGKSFQQAVYRSLPELSYFRDFIFESSLQFIQPQNVPENPPPLTRCERECLKWCSAGKSSSDIAEILKCSAAAVNFHFANLRRKFNVSTRHQVVVKALRMGLIDP